MLAAETELKNAEKVKQYLFNHHLLHPDYLLVKEFDRLYFPLAKKVHVPNAKVVNTKFPFPEKQKPATVEELLKGKLTSLELAIIPKSQEVVGKILILEIPEQLQKKERAIAEAYLKANKQIETVVKKDEAHSGEFRTRKVKVLAGKNTKETIHHENGIDLKVHLEDTYFTSRLASERLRIAKKVKKGERVLVMFAGVGPYALVIGKNAQPKVIYAVEINPRAHRYLVDNVALNHLNKKISVFLGDVRTVVPKLSGKFDRIVMPLPRTGEQFLDLALKKSRKWARIHLYAFLAEEDIKKEARKIKEKYKNVRVLRAVTCGQFSPRVRRVCFDLAR
ncbi:class I SAM-dependent methyltransferase family protein [Candidatus Woesearchaeota archaeon]|nr:class I SAM-dependent methyltransferase family protein [Candidatus Woesearchaeota archaeon]